MRYLILILIFISCQKNVESVGIANNSLSEIHIKESSKKESLKDYIGKIDVIKLNTDLNIVSASKVKYFENEYYFLDKKTSQLIVFDENGNFKHQIGKRGGGPEEYKKITDFEIDKKNKLILLLSNYDKALFKYALDGTFIERLRFDFFPTSFVVTASGNYVFYLEFFSENFNNIIVTDDKGKIIKENFPYPEETPVMGFAFTGGMHSQGASNYFSESTSSIVYEMEDLITPLYKFKFGNDTWEEENRYKLAEFSRDNSRFSISFLNNFYCDTQDVLAFSFTKKNFIRRGFYLKKNNKVLAAPFNLKIDYLYEILDLPVGVKEDRFISLLDYELYEALITDAEFKEELIANDIGLFQKIDGFSENDNPYLLLYKIKDE